MKIKLNREAWKCLGVNLSYVPVTYDTIENIAFAFELEAMFYKCRSKYEKAMTRPRKLTGLSLKVTEVVCLLRALKILANEDLDPYTYAVLSGLRTDLLLYAEKIVFEHGGRNDHNTAQALIG